MRVQLQHNDTTYLVEADRITLLLTKDDKKEIINPTPFFSLCDQLLKPEFQKERMNIYYHIPRLLAQYGYEIITTDPFHIKKYK